jgi:hypothetical protein
MDEAEKAKAQAANTEGYVTRYKQWMEEFKATGTDLRSLERLPMDGGRPLPAKANLAEATADADLIVEAVVESVTSEVYHMFPLSTVMLRVSSSAKGNVSDGDSIVVKMAGGPLPASSKFNPEEAVLVYDEPAPLLLPGDRAVLFLQLNPDGKQILDGEYTPQNFTGIYRVSGDGHLSALEGNPFAKDSEDWSVNSLFQQIRSLR